MKNQFEEKTFYRIKCFGCGNPADLVMPGYDLDVGPNAETWPEVEAHLTPAGYEVAHWEMRERGSGMTLNKAEIEAMADYINYRDKWEALREAADKALNRLANWTGSYDARIEHGDLIDALSALKKAK